MAADDERTDTDAASRRAPERSGDGSDRPRARDEGTVAKNIERVANKVKGLLRSDG
ncbi:hypothetical protein NHL50_00235 [Acidimicrobiia bacterium EGI L10123]|uniref:hypothetical protein n=1 Tax=Salinilacustrithrix flava TaxID=2957203 RepID=UPI003D7C2E0A|nr:hypothetical protein [Acidimicrobiia bacterium EGI L10123]